MIRSNVKWQLILPNSNYYLFIIVSIDSIAHSVDIGNCKYILMRNPKKIHKVKGKFNICVLRKGAWTILGIGHIVFYPDRRKIFLYILCLNILTTFCPFFFIIDLWELRIRLVVGFSIGMIFSFQLNFFLSFLSCSSQF